MKKIIIVGLIIVILSIFLTGCSLKKTDQTSAKVVNQENNLNKSVAKNEYITIVLNKKNNINKEKTSENVNNINTINNTEENSNYSNENREDTNMSNESRETLNTEVPENNTKNTYYIKINCKENVVNIYTQNEQGEYIIPHMAMLCSTGKATPQNGVYSILYKYRWLDLFGGVYGQYCSQVVGNILFHSVPYLEKYNSGSLEYWEYDKLGTSASAGCIRLSIKNAKWIYENCPNGTKVEFYSSEDSGPLGKPDEMKISSYTEYRDWDPTDLEEDNPWRRYFE